MYRSYAIFRYLSVHRAESCFCLVSADTALSCRNSRDFQRRPDSFQLQVSYTYSVQVYRNEEGTLIGVAYHASCSVSGLALYLYIYLYFNRKGHVYSCMACLCAMRRLARVNEYVSCIQHTACAAVHTALGWAGHTRHIRLITSMRHNFHRE